MIDQSRLDMLAQLDRQGGNLLEEILTQYLADTTERLARLHEGLSNQDAAMVAEIAHSIRGASGNVGATMMTALCARLEAMAGRGDVAGCDALAAVVDGEYERVKSALDTVLRNAPGGIRS